MFNFFRKKHKIDLAALTKFTNDFVLVEGGEFMMGDAELRNAAPHKVTVSSFYMQASTVTQEFWELVMGNNPSSDKSWKDNPVTDVSWYDCQEFIKKLNSLTGKKYRLPTEAEWEYAARGGKFSKGYKYAGSDDVNEVAWHTGLTVFKASESEDEEGEWIIEIEPNSNDKIHPVKEKKPNELGLYDMSGNVCEWCNDWFGDYRLNEAYSKNPQGPDRGTYKVLRGGGRSFGFEAFLVAFRCYAHPNNDLIGGFRLLSPVE